MSVSMMSLALGYIEFRSSELEANKLALAIGPVTTYVVLKVASERVSSVGGWVGGSWDAQSGG